MRDATITYCNCYGGAAAREAVVGTGGRSCDGCTSGIKVHIPEEERKSVYRRCHYYHIKYPAQTVFLVWWSMITRKVWSKVVIELNQNSVPKLSRV